MSRLKKYKFKIWFNKLEPGEFICKKKKKRDRWKEVKENRGSLVIVEERGKGKERKGKEKIGKERKGKERLNWQLNRVHTSRVAQQYLVVQLSLNCIVSIKYPKANGLWAETRPPSTFDRNLLSSF